MNTLIIIPARMASKRLPGKPMKDIGGKPMIVHTYDRCLAANIRHVFVAVDSEELAQKLMDDYGVYAISTKKSLPSGTDRVYAAYKKLGTHYDKIINVQGDMPFIKPKLIQQVNDLLDTGYGMTTLAAKLSKEERSDTSIVKVLVGRDGVAKKFSRDYSYSVPENYHHIGIYGFKSECLEQFVKAKQTKRELEEGLEQLRAMDIKLEIKVGLVEDRKDIPIGVNTMDDLLKARGYYESLFL